MDIKEKIKSYAHQLGIPLVRITTADPFPELLRLLEERKRLNYLSGWEPKNFELSCAPSAVLPGARSVICTAVPYLNTALPAQVAKGRGLISKFSLGIDYHRVLKDKLFKLLVYLKEIRPETEGVICVDNGPAFDRALAYRSGLGFYGKNNVLITREFGSFVFLGEIITNLELEPDFPLDLNCGECTLCLDNCPSGALVEPYCLNASRCLSYLTQNKGDIPLELRGFLENKIYGCDLCQDVCPWNKKIVFNCEQDFSCFEHLRTPELTKILQMNNQEFKEVFGKTAAGWKGRTTLQRNALVALANMGEIDAVPIIKDKLNDERAVIRSYAIWALVKLLKKDALSILTKHLKGEKNEKIKLEIEGIIGEIEDN
ncbi:MAG TPA: tRNA epoxyqueuosine(34) reductase QueG [Clostridia bacterium]|nr:tRNA epoxyqueuosine(34) reductase QueG [Clostridia bacterium]